MTISETQPLPPGWRWVRLGDIASNIQNGIYKPADHYGHGLPFIRMYNIQNNFWELDLQKLSRISIDDREEKMFGLNDGDLLISRVNSFELVGKCAKVDKQAEGYIFENMLIRVRLSETVDPLFVAQQLGTRVAREQIQSVAKKSIGQASINSKDLKGILIALPPLAEQRRIAALLSDHIAATERARAAAEARLAAARALPAALLREIFESDEAQGWEKKKLNQISIRITDGTHQPPPFTQDGIPFLFVRNIVSGKIDFNVDKYVSRETFHELTKRCRPEQGDVLYSAVGSFGVAVVVETSKEFTFQRHIAHIKPCIDTISPHFLTYYLNSPEGYRQSDNAAAGGSQRTVTLTSLAQFDIPLPSLSIQNHIVTILNDQLTATEVAIAAAEAQRDTIATLPAALLRRAFSGEL